jgi:pilus assembly protein CpaB
MKSKTLILMIVAIGCGLAASYMTSRVIADRKDGEEEKVTVLVAQRNLAMGTLVKEPEKLFAEKQFTKGEEPKRAIRTYDELKDRRLNKPLSAEQFATPDDLSDRSQDGLSGMMQKGMRAEGLRVNAESIVGGFVLPHSRVDIVSVVRRGDQVFSKIILQNVLVLAADQLSSRPDDKQAVVSSTVTVQVTPAQAEKLTLAQELGTLKLILRSWGDEEKVTTSGATPDQVVSTGDTKSDDEDEGPSPKSHGAPTWAPKVPDVPAGPPTPAPAVVKAPEPPPPPRTHTMTIINGESVTKAVFTLADKDGDTSPDNTVQVDKSPTAPHQAPAAK